MTLRGMSDLMLQEVLLEVYSYYKTHGRGADLNELHIRTDLPIAVIQGLLMVLGIDGFVRASEVNAQLNNQGGVTWVWWDDIRPTEEYLKEVMDA